MTSEAPHSAWRKYSAKELAVQFDMSAQELAKCAAEGLILPPAPRQKGLPYSEMDHLRLGVFKRCIKAGYSLEEVLDLIGRIHRRTAPIKTIILAKAYADDKLAELEGQLASKDILETVNLRCDADVLKRYIEALKQLQARMTAVAEADVATQAPAPKPPAPKPGPQSHAANRRATAAPQTRKRPVPTSKRSYPRTYGSLAEESRNLWRQATPGGRRGIWLALLLVVAGLTAFAYFRGVDLAMLLPGSSDPEQVQPPLAVESVVGEGVERETTIAQTSPGTDESETMPAAASGKTDRLKEETLLETATDDLKKIMAASGKTAAATSGNAPPILKINELVAFYDLRTRILRVKIELLKNLSADAPPVIRGRIFMVLRAKDEDQAATVITLPSTFTGQADATGRLQRGLPFSLDKAFTTYLKTEMQTPPALKQELTVLIYDQNEKLVLKHIEETTLKLLRS